MVCAPAKGSSLCERGQFWKGSLPPTYEAALSRAIWSARHEKGQHWGPDGWVLGEFFKNPGTHPLSRHMPKGHLDPVAAFLVSSLWFLIWSQHPGAFWGCGLLINALVPSF